MIELGALEGDSLETGGDSAAEGAIPVEPQKGDTGKAEGQDLGRDPR